MSSYTCDVPIPAPWWRVVDEGEVLANADRDGPASGLDLRLRHFEDTAGVAKIDEHQGTRWYEVNTGESPFVTGDVTVPDLAERLALGGYTTVLQAGPHGSGPRPRFVLRVE